VIIRCSRKNTEYPVYISFCPRSKLPGACNTPKENTTKFELRERERERDDEQGNREKTIEFSHIPGKGENPIQLDDTPGIILSR
jgi:hypothetical protein